MYVSKEENKKLSSKLIIVTGVLFVLVTYFEQLDFFRNSGFYVDALDMQLQNFAKTISNSLFVRLVVILFMASAVFTYFPGQTTTAKERKNKTILSLLCALGYVSIPFLIKTPEIVLILISTVLFWVSLFTGLQSRKRLGHKDDSDDVFGYKEKQFDQTRPLVDTEYSVNIEYEFEHEGQKKRSWINFINLFRALLVGGTPGSGKSFAVIEEIMRQFAKKGFCGVVYDYKFPTLTVKKYNYLLWYISNYDIKPKFYVINFDDISYSHRINPISTDNMVNVADAWENTYVLMYNLNRTWLQKQGDFFTDSAMSYTAMLMWYCKMLSKKYDANVCTIPHTVALATFESSEILFLILKEYSELKPFMKPFAEALEKGALEQLAGQVASAGIALSKIATKEIFYVLSGSDFSLDLNNPKNPKILCIGSNPERELTYSAPIGLILTRLTKIMNRQKRRKSFFILDEFPTIFLQGIDRFIATCRSNKIATVLGFQSFAQVIRDYTREIADVLINICGNIITGQVYFETAEKISKTLGKVRVRRTSYTNSQDGSSEQESIQFVDIVNPYEIAQFSQGSFCGLFADNFANKDSKKMFFGDVISPLHLKEREEDIELPMIYDFSPENKKELLKEELENHNQIIQRLMLLGVENTLDYFEEVYTEYSALELFDPFVAEALGVPYQDYKTFNEKVSVRKMFDAILDYYLEKKENPEEDTRNYDVLEDLEQQQQAEQGKEADQDTISGKVLLNRLKKLSSASEEAGKLSNFIFNYIQLQLENFIVINERNNQLENYYYNLYEEMYSIIAVELEQLGLIKTIAHDRKLRPTCINLFNKISNSDNIKNEDLRKIYKDFSREIKRIGSAA